MVATLLMLAMAGVAPEPPAAKCQVARMVEFPITMAGRRPVVDAKFGDKSARFIIDSGAFYSTISAASAAEYGLKRQPAPPSFRLKGIGGSQTVEIGTAKDFSLAGVPIPGANFIVGGTDIGSGLIGQNILALGDVEYDLPHGAVRLFKTTNCAGVGLAYWAAGKPFTMLKLEGEAEGLFKPHTIATVVLNGVKLRAVFDSGAQSSLLTLEAAKRVGVTPDSPGVTSSGYAGGLGSRTVKAWLAQFESIDIGGELIRRPKLAIAQFELGNADMLIGADFFLTHRIFVANGSRTMFITYEGGPLFGLNPKGASTSTGTAIDLTNKEAEPTTAEEYSRRGAAFASNRRSADAMADFDKAIAMAPKEGRYLYQRAMLRLANGDRAVALGDLDQAVALAPDNVDIRMTRAGVRLREGDRAGAEGDLAAADAALAPSSSQRYQLAGMYDGAGMPEKALASYDLWLKSHPTDGHRPGALNGRCWARGQLNRDLDKALDDCDAAIRAQPGNAAYLDSRALVRLRRGEWAKALADYDAAIAIAPRNAWSLYARGIVEAKMGDAAKAKADREAALAIAPRVAERAKTIGLEP